MSTKKLGTYINVCMQLSKTKAQEVITSVSNGSTLTAALKLHGVTRESFRKYIERDFQALGEYMAARRDAADLRAEEILEIADTDPDPLRARNRIDARKWYASKLDPKVYGERIDVNVQQRVDLTSVLDEARKRALPICDQDPHANGQVIETTGQTIDNPAGFKPVDPEKTQAKVDPNDLLS